MWNIIDVETSMEVIYNINSYVSVTTEGNTTRTNLNGLLQTNFMNLKDNPKFKIFHKVASGNPEVIVHEISIIDDDVICKGEGIEIGGSDLGNGSREDKEDDDVNTGEVSPVESGEDLEVDIAQEILDRRKFHCTY